MATSSSRGAALDATVVTDPDRVASKQRAAVDYYRRELAAAEEAVRRLEGKGDRLRAQAKDADAALKAAKEEVAAAGERLADAEAVAEGVEG